MKALVITKAASPESADPNDVAHCFASLDANSIQWNRAVVEALPSTASINDAYDFIVFPRTDSGYDGVIDDSNITIPMFALFASAGSTGFGATPGVSSARSVLADRWLDVPFTTENFISAQGGSYALSTGKALATVSATEPNDGSFTGSVQTNAGQVFSWRTDTAGGSHLYVSAHDPANHCYLPFLLQEAINDGVLATGGRFRRAPMSVDLDHINGAYATTDPTVIDKIASYVPAGGVLWCGIFNADLRYFSSSMDNPVITRLKQYSGNKFKYCWHTHVKLIVSGLYPNATELVNKATQEVDYLADKQTWEDNGLEFHQPAYYNSGSNQWSESTMELFTGDTSITADGGGAVTQKGYGFRVFRTIRSSTRAQPQKTLFHFNQHAYKHTAHGIQMLNTWDMAFGSEPFPNSDMPYNSIIDWRKNFQWVCQSISMGMTLYLHDEDFDITTTSQSPGIEQHGYVQMQILSDISEYMKDVVHGFADPTDYVPDMSMSMA